jgi:hypothetical protein
MIIRDVQIKEFEAAARRRFEAIAIAKLRNEYPERLEHTPDERLRADVRIGWESAGQYGLTDEAWVLEFLGYIVQFGSDFGCTPETAWGGRILERTDLTEEQKIAELEGYVVRYLI